MEVSQLQPALGQTEDAASVSWQEAPSLPVVQTLPSSFYRGAGKRAIDILLGVPLLLLAAPIILLLAAIIAVREGWPPFYAARRMGKDGREFSMWKLRTMVRDADQALAEWQSTRPELAARYAENFKLEDDPRVTRIGRFLRRTSLDELPQLWNVVRGEMSLVGPRPYYRRELEAYPEALAHMQSLRPGLTGPWQVNGRNSLHPQLRMAIDCKYAASCSLGSDLGYLARTIAPLIRANGV